MTHVFDVVKLGLTSTSKSAFTKWPFLVTVWAVLMIIMPCGYNSPDTQEPDEGKSFKSGFEAEAGRATSRSTVT